MVLENSTTKEIDRILGQCGKDVSWLRPVPGMYGKKYVDYIGGAWGLAFMIEAKRPGKQPKPHQALTLRRAHRAHCACFVIDGSPDSYAPLIKWLQQAMAQWWERPRPKLVLLPPKILGD